MPDQHAARRRRLRARFLIALAGHGIVARAAREARGARRLFYDWREKDEDFAAAWDKALTLGLAALEDAAMTRALDGTRRVVWYHGKPVGTERRPSDALMMFMLRNRLPDRYGWGPGGKAAIWARRDGTARDGDGGQVEDKQTPEQRNLRLDELLARMGLVAVPMEVARAAHAKNSFRTGLSGASLEVLAAAQRPP